MNDRDTGNTSAVGKGKTDWDRLDRMTDEEIDCSEISELDTDFWENAQVVMPGEPMGRIRRNIDKGDTWVAEVTKYPDGYLDPRTADIIIGVVNIVGKSKGRWIIEVIIPKEDELRHIIDIKKDDERYIERRRLMRQGFDILHKQYHKAIEQLNDGQSTSIITLHQVFSYDGETITKS